MILFRLSKSQLNNTREMILLRWIEAADPGLRVIVLRQSGFFRMYKILLYMQSAEVSQLDAFSSNSQLTFPALADNLTVCLITTKYGFFARYIANNMVLQSLAGRRK